MRSEKSKILHTYWKSIARSRAMPCQKEINPSNIKSILGDFFVIERLAANNYQFRLAGTKICNYYKAELRGKNFLGYWSHHDRECLETLLKNVIDDQIPAVLEFDTFITYEEKCKLEVIFLPVRLNESKVRIIGVISPIDSNKLLGREPIIRHKITDLRLLWPKVRNGHHIQSEGNIFKPELGKTKIITSQKSNDNQVYDDHMMVGDKIIAVKRRAHLMIIDGGMSPK